MKITPAHDPNDFEVGKRHNLAEIVILNDDATINATGRQILKAWTAMSARKAIGRRFRRSWDLLVKVVPHSHNVGTHDRCKTTVEPMIKAAVVRKNGRNGQTGQLKALKNGELKFVPESVWRRLIFTG